MATMLMKGLRGRSCLAKQALLRNLQSLGSSAQPISTLSSSSSAQTCRCANGVCRCANGVRYVNLKPHLGRFPFLAVREIQAQVETSVSDVSPLVISAEDHEIQAAGSALQSFLQKKYKAYLTDAAAVVENVNSSVLGRLAELTKAKSLENCQKSEVDFSKQVSEFLTVSGFDVLELVLASVGVPVERREVVLSKLSLETVDVQSLLFVVRAIEKLGIPRSSIGELIEKNSGMISYSTEEIEAGFLGLKGLEIPEEEIIGLIQKYPLVLKKKVMENISALSEELEAFPSKEIITRKAICDNPQRFHEYSEGSATAVVHYLRSYDLTSDRLNLMLQRHFRLIYMDVENDIKKKVQFLKDLGVSRKIIGKVIYRCPNFLFLGLEDNLVVRLDYFKCLGFKESEFALVISRYPTIFSASLENKIKPVVAELKTLGLTDDGVKKCVLHRPSLFAYKLGGEMSSLIQDLKDSGYSQNKKVTAFIKLYSRGSDHRKKVEACLVEHGLSASDAKMVLDKEPGVLGYNESALAVKLDNLTKTLGIPVQEVVDVPEYLSFGLKRRILKRQRVLSYLKSKGLLTDAITLKQLVSPSNKQFYSVFLKSHSKDEEIDKLWFRTRDGVGNTEGLDFLVSSVESNSKAQAKL